MTSVSIYPEGTSRCLSETPGKLVIFPNYSSAATSSKLHFSACRIQEGSFWVHLYTAATPKLLREARLAEVEYTGPQICWQEVVVHSIITKTQAPISQEVLDSGPGMGICLKSSPGDSNVQPTLRTMALMD